MNLKKIICKDGIFGVEYKVCNKVWSKIFVETDDYIWYELTNCLYCWILNDES
jgi:hypothetical protein